MIKTIRSFLV